VHVVDFVEEAAADFVERAVVGFVEEAVVDFVERAVVGFVEEAAVDLAEGVAVDFAEKVVEGFVERVAVDVFEEVVVDVVGDAENAEEVQTVLLMNADVAAAQGLDQLWGVVLQMDVEEVQVAPPAEVVELTQTGMPGWFEQD